MNEPLSGRFSKRSFSLKLLALGWLIAAILSSLRFTQALSNWDLLLTFGEPVLPLSLAVSGVVWMVVGLICAGGIWFKQIWAGWLSMVAAVLFSIWYWLDRVLLTRSQTAQTNTPFALIATFVLLLIVGGILTLNIRNNKERGENGTRG